VQVNDRAFAPPTVHVAVGATVTWNNVSRDHTVTAGDRSFDSGVFDAGQDFTHTFDAAGTVDYICLIHPEMTGTVVVGDAPAAPGEESSSAASPSSGASPSGTRAISGVPPLRKASQPPLPRAAASAGTVAVEVADFSFAPGSLTVAPGTTVRWTLTGAAPHTVTTASFDSGTLMAGDTFERTFDDVGTVEYRCVLHPEMTGTVSVVADAPTPGQPNAGADDTAVATPADTVTASALANTGVGTAAVLAALLAASGGMAVLLVSRRRRTPPG
jgi:plastocyanin